METQTQELAALERTINPEQYALKIGKQRLTALDIAREALAVDRAGKRLASQANDFAGHILQLAALCKSADEFDALCRETRLRMGWGRKKPTPRIFSVYASWIRSAWERHGIVPHQITAVPLLEHGEIVRDDHGEARIAEVRIENINQLKQAARALSVQARAKAVPKLVTGRPVAAQAQMSDGFEAAIQALRNVYAGLSTDKRLQLIADVRERSEWYAAIPVSSL